MRSAVAPVIVVCALAMASSARAQTPGAPDGVQPQVTMPDPAPPIKANDNAFASLFSGVKHDLMHVPSVNTALTLGAGGALALAVHPADRTLTSRAWLSSPLEFLDGGSPAGSGWIQGGAAVATWLIGQTGGNAKVRSVGEDLVQAQIVAALMTHGLKLAVDRTRPDNGRYSFPSGHASASFANASVLQRRFGWKVGLPAYGLASYVAASRLQENQHYASDVIFGAALGLVAGHTTTVGHGRGAFALTPVAVPGGAEVMFSHL